MSEITNTNTAKAVIATAKENDIWEAAIPSDENQLLADANFILEQAEAAWKKGIRGPAVTAVKFSAQVDGAHTGKDIPVEESEPEEEYRPSNYKVAEVVDAIVKHEKVGDYDAIRHIRSVDTRKTVKRAADAALESENDAYSEVDENGEKTTDLEHSGSPWSDEPKVAYPTRSDNIDTGSWTPKSKLDEAFEAESFGQAQAKKMNLPVPEAVDDIPSATLSRNVANLTISELAERLTDASLCLAAATWQTALAEIDLEHAKRVGNHYFNKEFPKAQENAKNKDAAVAKVEEVEEVKAWRAKEAEAENRYITFRALKEIYKGTYDTVSRVFAMKQEERERS